MFCFFFLSENPKSSYTKVSSDVLYSKRDPSRMLGYAQLSHVSIFPQSEQSIGLSLSLMFLTFLKITRQSFCRMSLNWHWFDPSSWLDLSYPFGAGNPIINALFFSLAFSQVACNVSLSHLCWYYDYLIKMMPSSFLHYKVTFFLLYLLSILCGDALRQCKDLFHYPTFTHQF